MKTAIQQLREEVINLRNEAHVNCYEEFVNAMNQVINRIDDIQKNNLPDFQRIDEERMGKILNNIVGSSIYYDQLLQKSVTLEAVRIYNSTLSKAPAQPPALKPLPKEMPALWHDAFTDLLHNRMQPSEFYSLIRKTYGTAEPKQPLPSVEELTGEVVAIYGATHTNSIHDTLVRIAQNIHSKYSLHPKQEDVDKLKEELENERIRHAACGTAALGYFTGCHEKYLSASLQDVINLRLKYEGLLNKQEEEKVFPFNLKEGDKFKWEKEVQKFKKFRTYLVDEDGITYLATTCTPYTTPSAQDIISKHNLTDEEVRVIREGNV